MHLSFLLLFILFTLLQTARADYNITIDDFDRTKIVYNPADQWVSLSDGQTVDRYMKTTTWTRTQGASASFNFTGATSIYYVGFGANPDQISMSTIQVQLDGVTYDVAENINRRVRPQQILFSQTGLDPSVPHTITVRKTSTSGDHDLNIDAFIYTVSEGTPGGVSDSCSRSVGPVMGALVGGFFAGAFLVFLVLLWLRRRSQQSPSDEPNPPRRRSSPPHLVELPGPQLAEIPQHSDPPPAHHSWDRRYSIGYTKRRIP